MSEVKRFEDKDMASAIKKACSYFNTDEDGLSVEVLDSGSTGIFGLGGRNTVIQAGLKDTGSGLEERIKDVVCKLLEMITDNPELQVRLNGSRADVIITDPENSGLIIGKDGQNIAAFEYLVNRVLAREWPEKVYVQLDAGDYRSRQDEFQKQNARFLAEKVKETGKTQSTKPLSSYHRRLVHMELQDDDQVATRSTGEGKMKRVLISPKKVRSEESSD
ncbi:MAG: KH domain-containing protein [Desulfohalobiaceae bacterium]|nr:KH domain-containing protein [Desulfohalobiaceae bacterium]